MDNLEYYIQRTNTLIVNFDKEQGMVSLNNYKNNIVPTWKAFIVVFIIKFGGPNIKPLARGVPN